MLPVEARTTPTGRSGDCEPAGVPVLGSWPLGRDRFIHNFSKRERKRVASRNRQAPLQSQRYQLG